MIKALETAIEKVRRLSPDRQAYVARVRDEIAGEGSAPFIVPDDDRVAVLEALGQLYAGRRASPGEAAKVLRKPWA